MKLTDESFVRRYKMDRETPKHKTLHLIADDYATHAHPAVQDWLAKHPRFNMHSTPTSACNCTGRTCSPRSTFSRTNSGMRRSGP